MKLSTRIQSLNLAPMFALAARINELTAAGKDIINLTLGEPDFDTPDNIKEGAIKAIEAGFTKYTPVDGIPSLKKAIIQKFQKENKINYDDDQIIVSSGSKQSLFNLISVLVDPGDEIIIPLPSWTPYSDLVNYFGGKCIPIKTNFENNFKINPFDLDKAITSKTKLIILNSPANPTGMAYSKEELLTIAKVLINYPNVIIASDDIYEHLLWSKPFANILMAFPELYSRCVIINGVSKTYAMTGWRIGYAAGPKEIVQAMTKVQSQSISCPSSISQAAALQALTGDQSAVTDMCNTYQRRQRVIVEELQKIPGFRCLPTDGAFYVFPEVIEIIKKANMKNDIEFTKYLLDKTGVAVVPGSIFGGDGHIRISYTINIERLKEAIKRLKEGVKNLL